MADGGLLLEVENLTKHFPVKGGLLTRNAGAVKAVDGVSFAIPPGQTLGLVGESGCGKTTTSKLILRLEDPTSGAIRFNGKDLTRLSGDDFKFYRRSVQAVFQDPFASLNPRMRVGAIIGEPLSENERLSTTE